MNTAESGRSWSLGQSFNEELNEVSSPIDYMRHTEGYGEITGRDQDVLNQQMNERL